MKKTTLTRTGLLLSALPIVSVISIFLLTIMWVEGPGGGILTVILSFFAVTLLGLLYVLYVLIRFFRFPKDDPAYPGVRQVSLVIVASLLFPRLIGLMLYLLEMKLGLTDWLEIFSTLTTILTYALPFLVFPLAEGVLYWKMRAYRS